MSRLVLQGMVVTRALHTWLSVFFSGFQGDSRIHSASIAAMNSATAYLHDAVQMLLSVRAHCAVAGISMIYVVHV